MVEKRVDYSSIYKNQQVFNLDRLYVIWFFLSGHQPSLDFRFYLHFWSGNWFIFSLENFIFLILAILNLSNYSKLNDKMWKINHSFLQLENYTYKYHFSFEFTACTSTYLNYNRKMLFFIWSWKGDNIRIHTYDDIKYTNADNITGRGIQRLLHDWKMLKNFYLLFTFISCRKIILDSRKCHPFRRLYMAYVCGPAFLWYVEIYSMALSTACKK